MVWALLGKTWAGASEASTGSSTHVNILGI